MCIIVSEQSDIAAFANYVPSEADIKPAASAAPEKPAPKVEAPTSVAAASPSSSSPVTSVSKSFSTSGIGGRIFASPLAKKLAVEKGIDLSQLAGSGTGPSGRIRAQDVLTAPAVPAAAFGIGHSAPGAYQDLSLTNIRQVIAKRLLTSKQTVPHYYLSVEIEVDELLK